MSQIPGCLICLCKSSYFSSFLAEPPVCQAIPNITCFLYKAQPSSFHLFLENLSCQALIWRILQQLVKFSFLAQKLNFFDMRHVSDNSGAKEISQNSFGFLPRFQQSLVEFHPNHRFLIHKNDHPWINFQLFQFHSTHKPFISSFCCRNIDCQSHHIILKYQWLQSNFTMRSTLLNPKKNFHKCPYQVQ